MSSRRVSALLSQGLDHQKAGRLEQAYEIYRQALSLDPRQADCHFQMGVLTAQVARHDLALEHFKAALKLRPQAAKYHLNMGLALDGLGRYDEAVASYREALRLEANYSQAHNNLANTLGRLGRLDEAETHYRAALRLNPNTPEFHNNLGHTLNCLGRSEEAAASCRRALELRPNYPAALNNFGLAMAALEQFAEAERAYRAVLGIRPDLVALRNLAYLLLRCRRPSEAEACFREALRLKPDDAQTLKALGDLCTNADRPEEAVAAYRAAVTLDKTLEEAWTRLAISHTVLGQQEEAVACHDEVLRLKPGHLPALVNRCMARLPVVYRDEAQIEAARDIFTKELEIICRRGAGASLDAVSGVPPFYLAYQGRSDRDLQSRYGRFVADVMASHYPKWTTPPQVSAPRPGEKIRVGFLSSYFYNHSNWKIPLKGWISGLDKQRFEIFGYHLEDKTDDETEIAKRLCHRFVQGLGALEPWAEAIRADKLHVLIIPGIGLDALTHRLAALRLAPVQATSWGHPDTTGLPTIDHYLSADLMEPPDGREHYTERLVRLPNLSIAYEPPNLAPAVMTRAELGVPEDAVFYWCCQALFKYLPRYDWVYPRIAAAVPNACFVFVNYARGNAVTGIFRDRLKASFAASGLDFDRHCRFTKPLDMARFGAVSKVADVFLDSLGWSGCNTTLEALANDLPIVTMPGELMRGRHSAAILTMLGLPETIAKTPEAYVELAIALGRDPTARQALRARIAEEKYRLYNDQTAVEGLASYLEGAAHSIALKPPTRIGRHLAALQQISA
jgi:predicted O-linked N-acetylglucosamine transferase (SPINDLY family)